MCNAYPLTPEEIEEEMKNPKFCGCWEMIWENGDVIEHICKRCRGD